jgi:two-component system sensor histidine kinase/response regulator
MRPSSAESGAQALGLLVRAREAENPFPLALIDGDMPGMNGFELAERIKQDPGLSGAMIMMLTSACRVSAKTHSQIRVAFGNIDSAGPPRR